MRSVEQSLYIDDAMMDSWGGHALKVTLGGVRGRVDKYPLRVMNFMWALVVICPPLCSPCTKTHTLCLHYYAPPVFINAEPPHVARDEHCVYHH